MITIRTYKALLYLQHGTPLPAARNNNGTDWLRQAVNQVYNRHKAGIKASGFDTSVFHDHDEETGLPVVRYPRVLYIRNIEHFFITGINEGAVALDKLMEYRKEPLYINPSCFVQFVPYETLQYEVHHSDTLQYYSLTDWLALSSSNYRKYMQIQSLTEKLSFLEQMLYNHIVKDFGKSFGLDFGKLQLAITGIDGFNNPGVPLIVNRHTHDFKPFTVSFNANYFLPSGICLGNGKAYGYGYLQRISSPA